MATVNIPAGVGNQPQTGQGSELEFLVTVSVDVIGNIGTFDQLSGADAQATPTKYRPGGMGPEITYPALASYSDLTVTRVYDEGRDHQLIGVLRELVGASTASVSEQPLDQNGNPYGTPRVFTGRLAQVNDGNVDSTSNSPRKWDLMVSVVTFSG